MGREIQILRIVREENASALTAAQLERASELFAVTTATAASEARRIATTTAVDCVVCDAEVAGLAGLDLLADLRDQDPNLPFFLVFDTHSETIVEEALAAGVTDCVWPETDDGLVANRISNAVAAASDSRGIETISRRLEESQDHTRRLSTSEAHYRSLVEDVLNVSHVGTFVLDATFTVVWINKRIESYFGVDAGIIGADKRELIDNDIKYIFEHPDRFAQRVRATYDDNSYIEQFECHVTSSDDREERWLEHQSYPITTGPYKGGRIEHYLDITARKHHEQELIAEQRLLDRLLETTPIGIVLLDSAGRISRANKHGQRVLGLSESDLTDRQYDDPKWVIHDADGEPIASDELPFARVRDTGEPVFEYEHGIELSDGTDRWLSINASPLHASDGTVDRVICAIADITEIRDSERELAQHNERLAEFASIVSHDLRNPLNVLAGSLELAAETGETAHFERSQRALTRMNQLINDLLALARTGEQIDSVEPVDIGRLAADCWQNLSVGDARLQVDTDRIVLADESRLTQLFENLFRNSVEHSSTNSRTQSGDSIDHGETTVTITVGSLPDGFFVADDGPGIPEHHRKHIFERGYSSRRDGTGLGLYIVSQIAEAHGWEIALADADEGVRIELTGVELVDAETDAETA